MNKHLHSEASEQADSAEDVVLAEQIKLLFNGIPFSGITTLINGSILAVIQYPVVGIKSVLVWGLVLFLVTAWRSWLSFRYYRDSQSHSLAYWHRHFLVGVILAGLVWGASAIWLFPSNDTAHQVFVAFVLAGMTAGAMTSLAYRMEMFAGYSIPALLPLIINLFLQESLITTAMGTMVALYMAMIQVGARRLKINYQQNIQLRLESDSRERARRESEERYRSVFEHSPLGIMHFNNQAGIVGCNPRFAESLGSEQKDLIGRNIYALVEDENILAAVRASLEGENSYFEGEYRAVLSGKLIHVKAYFSPVRDELGEVIGGVVLADDTTERELVRNELQTTQLTLSRILNTIPVRVFWKDQNGVYLGCNQLFAVDAGFDSSQDVIGKTDRDLSWDATLLAYREMDQEIVDNGQSLINFVEYREYADGMQRWFEISKVPLKNSEEQIVGILAAYQDITNRKLAEQRMQLAMHKLEEANEAKSDFLSSMSHELRTPLNAILGFAQILEIEPLSERQKTYTGHILDGGSHLLDLINQLLDLSRIESGKLEISIEQVSLQAVINESLSMVMPQADKAGLQIINEVDAETEVFVMADFTRLKQVIINLLSNAVKYNREKGWIKLNARVSENGKVRLTVSDNGIGIDDKDQEQLFEAFVRVVADKSMVDGAGIGLSISKYLVEMMGGVIGVDSERNVGSSFWVELKHVDEGELRKLEDTQQSIRTLKTIDSDTRLELIYIEDNLSNLSLVKMIIDNYPNIELRTATSPIEGLTLLSKSTPDLILLDINLPGMDGFEVYSRLRAMPHLMSVPVIAVSANAMADDIRRGMEVGFTDYMTKPLDIGKFVKLLEDRVLLKQAETQA